MKRLHIEKGRRFGKLVVITEVESVKGKRRFMCKCDCGNETTTLLNFLMTKTTKSCGCLKRENVARIPRYKKHGMSGTQFYNIYKGMRGRCEKEYTRGYELYGGRGIKCLWNSFEEFKRDMYASYIKHVTQYGEAQTSLDRKDGDGNYCVSNCRWATWKEQSANKRNVL